MKKTAFLVFLSIATFAGCQTTSQNFNGQTGYQVEQKTSTTATLNYTLANAQNTDKQQKKLQHACAQTLGTNKVYNITILDSQEIANPIEAVNSSNIQLGNSKTSFGFSNTPHLNNNQEVYASKQVEETRPNILKIIRFTCS